MKFGKELTSRSPEPIDRKAAHPPVLAQFESSANAVTAMDIQKSDTGVEAAPLNDQSQEISSTQASPDLVAQRERIVAEIEARRTAEAAEGAESELHGSEAGTATVSSDLAALRERIVAEVEARRNPEFDGAESKSEQNPESIYAAFGYNEKELVSSLVQNADVDTAAKYSKPELKQPLHPSEMNSKHFDFESAYEFYSNDNLYQHVLDKDGNVLRFEGGNCYDYAVFGKGLDPDGTPFDSNPYPGYYAGEDSFSDISLGLRYGSPDMIKGLLEKYMKLDAKALGKEIAEVGTHLYQPHDGERLFAMAITSPNGAEGLADFHYYLKGSDGYWTHKPGVMDPTNLDNSMNPIENPSECDRGIYHHLLGYYVVRDIDA